jgi:hypothetical protein
MAESHTLSALRAKYAELAGELRQIEKRAEQLRADCDHITHTILIFDPTAQPQDIQPKARRQSSSVFRHGEFARAVRDILRRAGKPMSLRDIADQIVAKHSLDIEAPGARAKLDAKIRTLLHRSADVGKETRDGILVWRVISE